MPGGEPDGAALEPAIDLDVIRSFAVEIPFLKEIDTRIDTLERGRCRLSLPWQDKLVGDPVSRVIHGGVITTLLDSASGMAVFSMIPKVMQIATLDLRIDYLRPAVPDHGIRAEAECYRLSRNVAFVRGRAFQDPDKQVASSLATFMLESSTL